MLIEITITVQGEPDTSPIIRVYQFHNNTDYIILKNSIKTIKNKLSRKMRININEALYIYLNYVINQLHLHKKKNEIITNVSKLLTPNQVMIGVPESLRKVNFNINTESKQKLDITVTEPILIISYILAADLENTK
ncbi:MAG TPA: urease subunit gamma [Nitrososphaeraceae archaeon]|nr:urease subunit gamma [Nitrososphaeraceae archaeon]